MTRGEERDLIERARAGDRDAAEAFVRAHQGSLYLYMLRMSGRSDVAEDVVQEAFVRVLTNLDKFDFRFRFSTWLFTIAKRLYVNMCQKHRPASDTDLVGSRAGADAGPEHAVDSGETLSGARCAIEEALLSVPAEQREVIVLFHRHGWPIALIASHLDMPEGTVKSHLHRGRRRMREAIERSDRLSRCVEEVLR
jgi:RNA polymerase sigma-70 factor (ECF subfamily)